MGYARRRPTTVNGNFHSRVLKPVTNNGHRWLWFGGLAVIVIGTAVSGLVYMRNSKKNQTAESYSCAHSQTKSGGSEVVLSDREIRLRLDAKRFKDSGRCDNDRTARAAAEAKEAMRNLFR